MSRPKRLSERMRTVILLSACSLDSEARRRYYLVIEFQLLTPTIFFGARAAAADNNFVAYL